MAAHRLQKRVKLWGFEISIENAKGSSRHWHDPHGGESGSTKMKHDYGYIRGTEGTDGDHVDVYVGPNHESQKVFVIDQMKKPDFKKFDEQKCMLGFDSAESAKAAYLAHYNDERFFGSMREMTMDDFKAKVMDRENHGKKVALDREKALRNTGIASGVAALPLTAMAIREVVKHPDAFPAWGTAAIAAAGMAPVLQALADREKGKKIMKTAGHTRLMAELNLAKLSAGEPLVQAKAPGDRTAGITTLPAVTNFSEATHTEADERKADQEIKSASEGRAGRIADRLDDVGIGILAAPYAADVASKGLMRVGGRNAKVRAAATALRSGLGSQSSFGHSPVRELGGLALVAPGVTHTLANKIDKTIPKKKTASAQEALEKLAAQLHPDYEYLTEAEKTAFVGTLSRIAASGAGRLVGGAKSMAQGLRSGTGTSRLMKTLTPMEQAAAKPVMPTAPTMGQTFRASAESATRGRPVSPQAMQRLDRMKAGKPPAAPGVAAPSVTPPAPTAGGGVPAPVPTTTAAPKTPAAGGSGKWNPLSARNVMLGGAAVGTGLVGYGGYKTIETGANLLQNQHAHPMSMPGTPGIGRVF
jgi:hypothetical protein